MEGKYKYPNIVKNTTTSTKCIKVLMMTTRKEKAMGGYNNDFK